VSGDLISMGILFFHLLLLLLGIEMVYILGMVKELKLEYVRNFVGMYNRTWQGLDGHGND